jgi:hypothetical protein
VLVIENKKGLKKQNEFYLPDHRVKAAAKKEYSFFYTLTRSPVLSLGTR